jgi:hypothetical protein
VNLGYKLCPLQFAFYQKIWDVTEQIMCLKWCFTLRKTATETWEVSKLVSKWKELAELKCLVSFPRTEVEWHQPIMPGGHSVHPWAECLKLRTELRNLLMKLVCHSLWFDWWDWYPLSVVLKYCDMRTEHVINCCRICASSTN